MSNSMIPSLPFLITRFLITYLNNVFHFEIFYAHSLCLFLTNSIIIIYFKVHHLIYFLFVYFKNYFKINFIFLLFFIIYNFILTLSSNIHQLKKILIFLDIWYNQGSLQILLVGDLISNVMCFLGYIY